ncbi:MAG TPA: HEAT repeat domain-containing protein [Pseudolabrys sp.]|nr:HEAT repeat domain-containing protein [Pseudolabrys sp.]
MQRTPEHQLEILRSAANGVIASLAFADPPFELEIGWASDYDRMFRGDLDITSEGEVLARALRQGRVVLVGRGGGGKTQLLFRLMRASAERGVLPVLIDLKDWRQSDYADWDAIVSKDIAYGSAFLIERFARPQTTAIDLDWVPPTASKVLIVDGLNEIASSVGSQVLRSLDEFVRDQILTSVIVADRLVRRELPALSRWALGLVLPLSASLIARYAGNRLSGQTSVAPLDLPFFLNAAIHQEDVSVSGARTHERYLISHANLTEQDLNSAAIAAFQAYLNKSRSFSIEQFRIIAGEHVTNRLQNSGVIILTESGEAHFSHHLLHDYLASRHMARQNQDFWTSDNLNVISLDQSSFDPLALVFEQLGQEKADDFLRRLYDWNLYAAGYALSSVSSDAVPCSAEMRIVIFAMLAEKRFDLVEATRQRANDALLLIRLAGSQPFKDAMSFQQVLRSVAAVNSQAAWFTRWQALFTRPSDQNLTDEDIQTLLADDSVIGWTMANVARRMALTEEQLEMLRNALHNAPPTQRWRIVHLLGAFPSTSNFDTLLQSLDHDSDGSVRYGAARSLAELACRGDAQLRGRIVQAIKNRVDDLRAQPKVRDEIARALVVTSDAAPAGWSDTVTDIGRTFFQRAEAPESRDYWRRYIADAEIRYQGPALAGAH